MRFRDRADAGRRLAAILGRFRHQSDVVVLGLPRGGVPVAREVAHALGTPLDILGVRKLGLPGHPEFGMGAIGEGGVRILDAALIRDAGISPSTIADVERHERTELERQARLYRGGRAPIALAGRTALIVDDGLATGGTARAAVRVARARGARHVVVAVPVAPMGTIETLRGDADEVVAVTTPPHFLAVGAWYDDFTPTSDAEVIRALIPDRARTEVPPARASEIRAHSELVRIPVDSVGLEGLLDVPESATGVVVFAHGSGSSRHSVRNRAVAGRLRDAGFATLLLDLLTETEAHDRSLVFNTELLGRRLGAATEWIAHHPELSALPVGLFGASTGAAAALRVAATPGIAIRAVVSRGGRPDLAGDYLRAVRCPTLLIVGGADEPTLEVNRFAARALRGPNRIVVIPGATHLFEEPGALEAVARLATEFFATHFDGSSVPSALAAG